MKIVLLSLLVAVVLVIIQLHLFLIILLIILFYLLPTTHDQLKRLVVLTHLLNCFNNLFVADCLETAPKCVYEHNIHKTPAVGICHCIRSYKGNLIVKHNFKSRQHSMSDGVCCTQFPSRKFSEHIIVRSMTCTKHLSLSLMYWCVARQ